MKINVNQISKIIKPADIVKGGAFRHQIPVDESLPETVVPDGTGSSLMIFYSVYMTLPIEIARRIWLITNDKFTSAYDLSYTRFSKWYWPLTNDVFTNICCLSSTTSSS